ncbi:MAG: hypothetical protein ACK4SY_00935 [Pyrobaculum sp.]
MLCTSLVECIENFRPREIFVMSSPLGGLGVLTLAVQAKLSILTSGPVFNKIALLEAVDNFDVVVKYVPRVYTSVYRFVGERVCWVAGPPLVRAVALGYSTSLSVYTCNKAEGVERLFESGKPIEAVSSRTIGGGRDGRDFDIMARLRSLQIKGDDEEEIADRVIRGGIFDVDDLDLVSKLMWRIASRWKNRSAVVFKDPTSGLGITIPMVYYSTKVIAAGQDCPSGRCIKTTAKLLERALRLAPQSKIHDAWRQALREPQTRRKIEESPYIPAILLLTGKIEVKHDAVSHMRVYYLVTSLHASPSESA